MLEVIFNMIGTSASPFYVEVGYNQPFLSAGSNTLYMHEKGWSGLLVDGLHENHSINLHAHFVTPDNIVTIFDEHDVPLEPDYVSIDIDSLDVWVARSLLKSKYRSVVTHSLTQHSLHYATPPFVASCSNQLIFLLQASRGVCGV